jgi:hypothetical protein
MSRHASALLCAGAIACTASTTSAQSDSRRWGTDDDPTNEEGCISILVIDALPALAEWTWWIGVGGGAREVGIPGERGLVALRLGGAVTFPLASVGEPSYGGPVHLRWGPWIQAETAFDGVLGEGGLELHLGQERHARWGTFGVRVGAGYGIDETGTAPHAALTLYWGVHSVPDRYWPRGACDPPRPRATHAFATGFRIFATGRLLFEDARGYALIAGIEIEPTYLFPPISLAKLIGSGP